jgi:hypothetical protein
MPEGQQPQRHLVTNVGPQDQTLPGRGGGVRLSAAQRLHISQPAVSMQINNLEKRRNTVLFDRSGRNIRRAQTRAQAAFWDFCYSKEIRGFLRTAA